MKIVTRDSELITLLKKFPHSPLGIARPAWRFIVPLAVVAVVAGYFFVWAGAVFAVLACYVAYFFRDPKREFSGEAHELCSPADGKVVSIIELPCEQMPGGRARRVAIFLNIFNVHLQRAPMAGRVVSITKKPGQFMNAMNEKCSEENEHTMMWLDCDGTPVGVRQITGAIARRIVCYVAPGDQLARGEHYGLIQFGSRVELFLPLDAEVAVKIGDHVAGGETKFAALASKQRATSGVGAGSSGGVAVGRER